MKALTLSQPWATLVAIGAKKIETRSWRTDYRGPLAIHAAKGMPMYAAALCLEDPFLTALRGLHAPKDLPRGAVVAITELINVVPTRIVFAPDMAAARYWAITPHEREFGDYSDGRWAWIFADVVPVDPPSKAKGALGLWEWTEE